MIADLVHNASKRERTLEAILLNWSWLYQPANEREPITQGNARIAHDGSVDLVNISVKHRLKIRNAFTFTTIFLIGESAVLLAELQPTLSICLLMYALI